MRYLRSDELLAAIARLDAAGASFAIVTVLTKGKRPKKLLVTEQDTKMDDLPGPRAGIAGKGLGTAAGERGSLLIPEDRTEILKTASQMIESGRSTGLVEIEEGDRQSVVTIEVIRPRPSLIVFGAGHVGHAVALIGNMIGYFVTVVDDREAFANRQRLPDPAIEILAEPFETAAGSLTITSNTAIVIVTRGHQYDELCLRSVIESRARYIGMIGSRRRVISVFKQLTESGVDRNLLDRVHAPIGLSIGAKSPQEIAVAIMAEIIQTFNAQKDPLQ